MKDRVRFCNLGDYTSHSVENCPAFCYFTPYSSLQPQLAIFSMPQDEIYLTNLLDPYLSVSISEISFSVGSLGNLSPTGSLKLEECN